MSQRTLLLRYVFGTAQLIYLLRAIILRAEMINNMAIIFNYFVLLSELLKSDADFILIADIFSFSDSFISLSQSIRIFYMAYRRRLHESFPQQMTVVLGMHRSGTSALTGLLGNLGISGPKDPLGATENNLLGYWESTSLVTSSDRFLLSQNSHWSQLYHWSSSWWKSAAA